MAYGGQIQVGGKTEKEEEKELCNGGGGEAGERTGGLLSE